MYEKLFEPMKINQCEIPNRMIVTAMASNFCNEDGTATERFIRYHEEKAKGGWGLIITGDYATSEHAKGYRFIGGLYDDSQIPSHRKVTDAVHKYDTKIFCQIYHPGRQTAPPFNGGVQPVAPSPVPCVRMRVMPRELTVEEIHEIVGQFGDTALRAKKAGFDGVEIHAAHGYLLTQFLSPAINKRVDEYGGTLENRARILHEILDDIRSKVGRDFPVSVRINALDLITGSRSFIDAMTIARMLQDWTADAINLSAGIYGADRVIGTMYDEDGWITDYAKKIKEVVSIPVISSNRITDPAVAETILADGRCDFVGMGRASLADPHFPNKLKEGDVDGIRRCLGCYQGCISHLGQNLGISCLVNPGLGLEYKENPDEKVKKPKNIMIVGAGVAGMEAAVTAARRGHHVTIYEKNDEVGGEWRAAGYPPYKNGLNAFTVWLKEQMRRLGVDVRLNTEMDGPTMKKIHPDAIIIATGGQPIRPKIKGIDRPNVYNAEDVLKGNVDVKGPAVVCGGGEVGCETAEVLAQRMDHVDVVEMRDSILIGALHAKTIRPILERYHVGIHVNSKVVEFNETGVVVETPEGRETIPAASIVLGMGFVPYNPLERDAQRSAKEVHVIGTALKAGDGLKAVAEGYRIGMRI